MTEQERKEREERQEMEDEARRKAKKLNEKYLVNLMDSVHFSSEHGRVVIGCWSINGTADEIEERAREMLRFVAILRNEEN